ncbi:MAG: hypothetical protein ABIK65_00025 [Candidatus Eisenbacteria bacterium]
MKTSNQPALFGLVLVTVATLVTTVPAFGGAGKTHTITLSGGDKMEGLVVPLTECAFLVQTEDASIEVPLERIETVDGSKDITTLFRSGENPLLREDVFERVLENGDVILHSTHSRENRGPRILDHLSWGIAGHEESLLADWKVFDIYGNELTMTVEEPDEKGRRQARASFIRPILPGEPIRFSDRIVFHDRIQHEGDHLRYRHRGDYPEDRLVTKMILLPAGARVIAATPEPLRRFDLGGAPCLVWRRFFARGEVYPIEVDYELGG